MRPVRWNEQALTPVGWKWEALRMGSCRGGLLVLSWLWVSCAVSLHYTILYLRIFWAVSKGNDSSVENYFPVLLICFTMCSGGCWVFLRLIWPLPVNTMQYKVSCFQWLASSHPTSLLFKLVHSAVVKETSLCCWTTSNFPVILTLRDCPIHTSCILLTNSGLE